jgi:stage II sporulation protein E
MKELYSYNINNVFDASVEQVCRGCGLRSYCWEKDKQQSKCDLNKLTPIIMKNGKLTPNDFVTSFSKRCCKAPELVSSINKNYDSYVAYLSAERRVGEIRSVVAGQFCGLGDILEEMAEEFENYSQYDSASAQRISALLKMEGFTPFEVSCRTDRMNRMTVEIEVQDTERNLIKKAQLVKAVSKACGRYMDTPCISIVPNKCRIQMSERPLYDVQIGSAQHISGNGRLCGDCYNYFAMAKVLLDLCGIDNLPVERYKGSSSHYWLLVNAGTGWYHYDPSPQSAADPFRCFMKTDAHVKAYSRSRSDGKYDFYKFNESLYPERATEKYKAP